MLVQLAVMALLWPGATGAAAPAPREGPQPVVPFTGLLNPYDIETDTIGNVYVADTGNNRVVKLPAGGGAQVVLPFTGLSGPTGLAIAVNGDVYLSDTGNGRVLRLKAGSSSQEVWATVNGPRGLAIVPSGDLHIVSFVDGQVYRRPANQNTLINGSFENLTNPEGVAVDPAGNVYATDTADGGVRVKLAASPIDQTFISSGLVFPNDLEVRDGHLYIGNTTSVMRTPLAGGSLDTLPFKTISNSHGIAFDPLGNLYVNNSGASKVLELPVVSGTSTTRSLGYGARGVARDALGNLYVVDTGHNRVGKIPANGGAETTLPFTGLSSPYGVAVDGTGNVFVTDLDNVRVVKLNTSNVQSTVPFTGLNGPANLATDIAGSVYVTDSDQDGNSPRVLKMTVGGVQSTLPFTGLTAATAVAVDRFNNVYVLDYLASKVLMLPAGGGAQVAYPFTGLTNANQLAVDNDRNLYLTGYGATRVIEVTADGDSQQDLGLPTLSFAYGIVVDPSGSVTVSDGANSRLVTLNRTMPELRVTTSPAVPGDILVDGIARESWGLNWAQHQRGIHLVCFGEVPGLVKPPCQQPTLYNGTTTALQGTYTSVGYLRALTSPALPGTITVDGVPRNDWGMWAESPTGTYNVCFGAVAGYTPPPCRNVTVTAGTTAATTGTYTPNGGAPGPTGTFGYLRATTSPAVGAMISLNNQPADEWGLNWVKLPVGLHSVCFGPAPNMIAPSCQTVQITTGNTTVVTGTYVPKGFLRVSTSPAVHGAVFVDGEVADNWGMWTAKTAGTYDVCFGPVVGYISPPCQYDVAVTSGNTTNITGTYTPG